MSASRIGLVPLEPDGERRVAYTPDPAVGCVGDSGGPLLLGQAQTGEGRRGVAMVLGVAHNADCATFTTFYRAGLCVLAAVQLARTASRFGLAYLLPEGVFVGGLAILEWTHREHLTVRARRADPRRRASRKMPD